MLGGARALRSRQRRLCAIRADPARDRAWVFSWALRARGARHRNRRGADQSGPDHRPCAARGVPVRRSFWSAWPIASRAISASRARKCGFAVWCARSDAVYDRHESRATGRPFPMTAAIMRSARSCAWTRSMSPVSGAPRRGGRARQASRPRHRVLRRGYRARAVRGRNGAGHASRQGRDCNGRGEPGPGARTVFAQIAADALGIDIDRYQRRSR